MIDLKREINEDSVFVMKAKTLKMNVLVKQIHSSFCNLMSAQKFFRFFFGNYIYDDIFKKKNDLKNLEELADLQSIEKQVRLAEKLGKQGFQCDTKILYEPINEAVTDTSQKLHEETKSTPKAIEELDESNVHVKTLEIII